MKSPRPATRTSRNQPADFHQSLAASFPMEALPAEPAALTAPRLTGLQARLGLAIIWILATIAAGVGIGLAILDSQSPATTEAPVPLAEAPVTVTSASANASASLPITQASPLKFPDLIVVPAAGIGQASAGITQTAAGIGVFHQTGGPDSLQPGYAHFGRSQGNIGTLPVR
jgi:hypothetical protein